MKTDKKVLTFGEVMMRLTPPDFLRFTQTRSFNVIYAGAEVNVAIALANLGAPVEFVTCLPENDLGDACINYIRQFGVGIKHIIRSGNRLGTYYTETGAIQRGNKVIYDRENSAFANIQPKMIDWNTVFSDAHWFHWSGITPAVSKGAADTCLEAIKIAKKKGLTISCDLNYRSKLWKWGKTPEEIMSNLLKYVDIVIGNEEDMEKVFDIKAPGVDVTKGQINAEKYRFVTKKLIERFPHLQLVAITLRQSLSASHNKWTGVMYDGKTFYKSTNYDISHIVDRVGAGDAFSAGFIYQLLYEKNRQHALDFAVALSCLKHTIYGDSCMITLDEVKKLMKGAASGRISR
jgi:2-dehydro-3-deoxygluconokinase